MREVVTRRIVECLDRPAARSSGVEERLDLLLLFVDELAAGAEELDAVVLGRVVRSRDHDPELGGEKGDRGRRKHATEDGHASCRGDAARHRLLELGAGATCVAADEDAPTAGPQRRSLPDPLDELGGQVDADDPTDSVRSEVAAGHAREASAY